VGSSLPVTVLTGFLGSGKTTLLQRLLHSEGGARTAVLINEFGEVGIDHLVVRNVSPTSVVLQNGCICCTIRADLQAGLRDLIDLAGPADARDFERIIIETTGLADPVPVVQTLSADPMLRNNVRLASLVSTADCLRGLAQLETHGEALRQAATADRLVLTKTDISEPEQICNLRERLAAVNPTAAIIDTHESEDLWGAVLGDHDLKLDRRSADVGRWFGRLRPHLDGHSHGNEFSHSATIRTFAVQTEQPLDWTAFAVWLSALVHRHGSNVLRIKGLLNVPGAETPVLINAVQKFVHPPVHLEAWPDADRSSRLVFITQGIEPAVVRQSLQHFLGTTEASRREAPTDAAGREQQSPNPAAAMGRAVN
jgi:G3E family GTPase